MDYLTLCLSRYNLTIFISCSLLSSRLNVSYVTRPASVYSLVPRYPIIVISCVLLSYHLHVLFSAIRLRIYCLSCLPGTTHLVKVCFPERFKPSDLRRCSSHLAVLAFTTFITTVLLYSTSDTVPGCTP